jgi:hypothetical protein
VSEDTSRFEKNLRTLQKNLSSMSIESVNRGANTEWPVARIRLNVGKPSRSKSVMQVYVLVDLLVYKVRVSLCADNHLMASEDQLWMLGEDDDTDEKSLAAAVAHARTLASSDFVMDTAELWRMSDG